MVKSKFPGKPSKHFQRRKVSPEINEDFEGLKAAEDIYYRLSVFDFLFREEEEEEVSSFHGFSPHEFNSNSKPVKKNISDAEKLKRKNLKSDGNSSTCKLTKSSKIEISSDKSHPQSTSQVCDSASVRIDSVVDVGEDEMEKSKKNSACSVMPLSGKFVLPSRSAHSSRVIKPNKRFIQHDGVGVPLKKKRLKIDNDNSIQTDNVPEDSLNSENNSFNSCHSSNSKSSDSSTSVKTSSPVKFVLRKPRLKIKSQPFSKVEGPFSSPGNKGGLYGGTKYRNCTATKVVCGVCWTVRSYKFLKQARKFGIFACEHCRRFILKILKTEREKLLKPLECLSGTGSCRVRNSTFVSHQPFATPPKKSNIEVPRRCQGCWLNLCLKSFKMPVELTKRLATYLPSEILQKYPISSFNTSSNESSNSIDEVKNSEIAVVKVIKKRKPAEEMKRVKNRQKLLLAGPRVKHVCRSASLVLGQPAATFSGNSSKNDAGSIQSFDGDLFSAKSSSSLYFNHGEADVEIEIPNKQEHFSTNKYILKGKAYPLEQQPARMLQELGRANCELLDGFELHDSVKKFAKISIDFWETYDPEEVLQSGFPLLGLKPLNLRAICFLCGSAGFEKLVHCSCCCEPYHTFCVSPALHLTGKEKNWWKLDWLCPKCIKCEMCLKPGGNQLICSKCSKSFHNACVPPGRAHISDNSWVCPSCLFCKSCNDPQVHVFIGNVPLCKSCFKQRKKGNFCPLCQGCYDENDYSTKMMECSDCKCWIHANCEGLSDEKYQVLSNLPSTIEFVCRDCCKEPPALWSVAVNAELRAGYLNVMRSLTKNRSICSYLKGSPKKNQCTCLDSHIKPIHLKDLLASQSEISLLGNKTINASPFGITEEKNTDLGLLTPKLTKDDEESLQTVKSGFLNLVTMEDAPDHTYSLPDEVGKNDDLGGYNKNSSQLLSIACSNAEMEHESSIEGTQNTPNQYQNNEPGYSLERPCKCIIDADVPESQPLSLMIVKNKANNDEYSSVLEFNQDMEKVISDISRPDILNSYHKSLRQIFPWFDPATANYLDDAETITETKAKECRKNSEVGESDAVKVIHVDNAINELLHHDQDYYYIGLDFTDNRFCMLCKMVGEGIPTLEGRLLYCGQNEWVHVNCALWSSEVFEEIDGSLQNVHSAISRARLIRCFGCDKKGASVGCCAKSCPSAYHFGCAISADCIFLENKEVFCKLHKNFAKAVHKEVDFTISRSVYVELDHKKKKEVLRNEVCLYLGSLTVLSIGEIIPELSDFEDILVPCELHCSRLYWSSVEPWKLVRYYVKTKVTNPCTELVLETETNYTIDHSLEFTPPPSPVDVVCQGSNKVQSYDEKEIKQVVNHIVDVVCNREEENNISENSTADLLPPELKEAIFEDLPHDLLVGISMNDIFPKMNIDDNVSEIKQDKLEKFDFTSGETSGASYSKRSFNEERKRKFFKSSSAKNRRKIETSNNYPARADKTDNIGRIQQEQFLGKMKEGNWKPYRLLQVDGTADFSESDQSDDSCDVTSHNAGNNTASIEDNPVKCSRCHRTYRSIVGYERHLPTCSYLSSSESDSSEEERDRPPANLQSLHDGVSSINNGEVMTITDTTDSYLNGCHEGIIANTATVTADAKPFFPFEPNVSTNSCLLVNGGTQISNVSNSSCSSYNNSSVNHINYEMAENVFDTSLSDQLVQNKEQIPSTTRTYENFLNPNHSIVELENPLSTAPTIILQQMPADNVIPTFIPSYSQNSQQNIQYITTSVNNQDKYIASHLPPGTFHIQPAQAIQQPVVQNIPTVLGTIIQANGVEQIVLNGPNPSPLDVYPSQQNNVYITNAPMIMGMETVVSNTVMSSSQFISGSMPGMLAASSYSATTTQVFQATKPVIDIPQSYVVVNSNPPIMDDNTACMQPNILHNNMVPQGTPWTNLISCQDPYKLNKSVAYQTVTRQIIHEQKEIDGVKMINSTEETIVIEPLASSQNHQVEEVPMRFEPSIFSGPKPAPPPPVTPYRNMLQIFKPNCQMKSNPVKIVELPNSSSVCKEKPQQAVAPVVVKNVCTSERSGSSTVVKKTIVEPALDEQPNGEKEEVSLQISENISPSHQPNNSYSPSLSDFSDIRKNDVEENAAKLQETKVEAETDPPLATKTAKHYSPVVKVKKEHKNISKTAGEKKGIFHEVPKITYEITSDDGFSFTTGDLRLAWLQVFEKVQTARQAKGLPPLTENPFSSPSSMLTKMMGLGNNSVKYVLEQLPGASGCTKYNPVYHRKKQSALEREMYKDTKGNLSGCARTENCSHNHTKYDMFSWLASRHRRPPKLLPPDNDCINGGRRNNMNLPMAMRFRHLKETSKAVGVFRSDIHGRGLFCLRDIDSGEMVIEYAGEVIRSALTDKRERHYTSKGIGCYMFRIDDQFVVDATMKGNAARFINHSCEPNCYSKVVDILGKKHIIIFATRRILQGEELTYDYKFPLEEDKINCHCLSRRCRKYLN